MLPRPPRITVRTWPAEPVICIGSRSTAPGGRSTVIARTSTGPRQLIVSRGLTSAAPEIQVVRWLASNAADGWSCGSGVYVDEAATVTCRPPEVYRWTSPVLVSTAVPDRLAGLGREAVKDSSKPYCCSLGVTRAGEHTQRAGVSMHPVGCGSALASMTADGSLPPGSRTSGASIVRLACTPGIKISLMPTWLRPAVHAPRTEATRTRSHVVRPGGTRST